MARLRRRHARLGHLADLAPLVDVALLLVVFMLLTAEAEDGAAEQRQLPVQLPAAETGTPGTTEELVLTILADGSVQDGQGPVRREQLAERAAGRSRAVLRIDQRCDHGDVVTVVDGLRAAGVTEIVEMTELPGSTVEEW